MNMKKKKCDVGKVSGTDMGEQRAGSKRVRLAKKHCLERTNVYTIKTVIDVKAISASCLRKK